MSLNKMFMLDRFATSVSGSVVVKLIYPRRQPYSTDSGHPSLDRGIANGPGGHSLACKPN